MNLLGILVDLSLCSLSTAEDVIRHLEHPIGLPVKITFPLEPTATFRRRN